VSPESLICGIAFLKNGIRNFSSISIAFCLSTPITRASSSSRSRSSCTSRAEKSRYQTITTGACSIWKPAIGAISDSSTSGRAVARSTTTARRACTLPQKEASRAASSIFWTFSRSTGL